MTKKCPPDNPKRDKDAGVGDPPAKDEATVGLSTGLRLISPTAILFPLIVPVPQFLCDVLFLA